MEREDYHAAIHRVRDYLGPTPRAGQFVAARQALFDDDIAAGRRLEAFASYNVIVQHYGCWHAALIDAGLPPVKAPVVDAVTGRASRTGARNEIVDGDLVEGIREARAAMGEPFNSKTHIAYRTYRKQQGPVTRSGRRPAAYVVVWQRFGSWAAAMKVAFPDEGQA